MKLQKLFVVAWLGVALGVSACSQPTKTLVALATTAPSGVPTAMPEVNMLKLTLNLDHSLYKAGEPVQATLSLQNMGADKVLVNGRMLVNQSFAAAGVREVVFRITRPSGAEGEYRFLVNARLPQIDDFVDLAAGDSIQRKYSLETTYNLSETGKYSVQVVYQNQMDPGDGRMAWKGELKSNEVKFTIEP